MSFWGHVSMHCTYMFEFARNPRNLQSHSRNCVKYFIIVLRIKLEIRPESGLLKHTLLADKDSRAVPLLGSMITNTRLYSNLKSCLFNL